MERLTARLPERCVEWVRQQAGDELQAPVVRDVFRAVIDGEGPYADSDDVDDELHDRVAQLEAAVFNEEREPGESPSDSAVSGWESDTTTGPTPMGPAATRPA